MFLLSKGPFPFTAADIRADLGLITDKFDALIAGGIGSICSLSVKPVREEVWQIVEGGDLERYGKPTSVSEPHGIEGTDVRMFCDVTYAADPDAIAKARARVVAWCQRQSDIGGALFEQSLNVAAENMDMVIAPAATVAGSVNLADAMARAA